jgi:hypothetical protein
LLRLLLMCWLFLKGDLCSASQEAMLVIMLLDSCGCVEKTWKWIHQHEH